MIRLIVSAFILFAVSSFFVAESEDSTCTGTNTTPLYFDAGIPYIYVGIDDRQVKAYIDTGSPVSFADAKFVSRRLPKGGSASLESYYGAISAYPTSVARVDIGNCSVIDVPTFTPTSSADSFFYKLIDDSILLGRNFIGQFDMVLDGPQSKVIFRSAPTRRDRTERAYAVEYKVGESRNICLFDSGYSNTETMFIHQGAPILEDQKSFQALYRVKHGASRSGSATYVSIFGSIAEKPYASFIAAIEFKNAQSVGGSLDYCIIGTTFIRENKLLLRSDKRLIVALE